MLNDLQTANAPYLTWTLVGWTWRGNVLVIEWESSNRYGDRTLRWRGADRLIVVDGRIVEEIVHADTAPLQALRQGRRFDALIQLPA